MRYMMFVCVDPAAEKYVSDEDNIEEWVEEMDRRKVRVLGNRLEEPKDAKTVLNSFFHSDLLLQW